MEDGGNKFKWSKNVQPSTANKSYRQNKSRGTTLTTFPPSAVVAVGSYAAHVCCTECATIASSRRWGLGIVADLVVDVPVPYATLFSYIFGNGNLR